QQNWARIAIAAAATLAKTERFRCRSRCYRCRRSRPGLPGQHSCCGGSSAQLRAARSDVTWAMCNVCRLGLCERNDRGPRRRALHITQVTSG
ncbi:hypothetical protein TYRP_020750, partial [Tyrophagus putrescentiae]